MSCPKGNTSFSYLPVEMIVGLLQDNIFSHKAFSLNAVTLAIDSTVATLTGSQTLTNKTFTSPTINEWTFASGNTMSGLTTESTIVFEGATADAHETSLNVKDPTQDNVITIPDSTMTAVTTATHSSKGTVIAKVMAMG